jgi:thioredoxin-like negative regulator of GroEL
VTVAASALLKPRLVFFYSPESGRCRRVDGYLAQVLQQRKNHDTFTVYRVDHERHQDLAERFNVERVPTLYVVEGKRVLARLEEPRGCRDIQRFLAPWLN